MLFQELWRISFSHACWRVIMFGAEIFSGINSVKFLEIESGAAQISILTLHHVFTRNFLQVVSTPKTLG